MSRNAGLFKPPHPGEVLAVYLGDEITLTEAATEFEIDRFTLSLVLSGWRGITPGMAVNLGRALGTGAEFWLKLQISYENFHIN
jgi:antitoxin HigA-1